MPRGPLPFDEVYNKFGQFIGSPTAIGLLAVNVYRAATVETCMELTHWGRVTHICVNKLTIIGSDNGLSPGRRQAIIWTNAGILLIGPWGTNFSEILSEIHTFSFKKMRLKKSSGKWPQCVNKDLNMPVHLLGSLSYDLTSHHITALHSFTDLTTAQHTTGSALDGALFDIAQILAYLVHIVSRSQLYLGFGHFGWLPSFLGQ